MSQSKQKSARRARKVQPDRHDRATAAEAVSRLPEVKLLERIRQARIERNEAEEELALLIDAAVSHGVGWPQIATQLGVTRQAARQQYHRRHASGGGYQGHVA